MNDLDYLRLSKPQKFVHKLKEFVVNLPRRLLQALKGLVMWIIGLFKSLGLGIADLVSTYIHGDWKTKISYTVMGFGSMARGQWLRGILFFAFQTVFNWYMYAMGIGFVKKLVSLGTVETATINRKTVYGDNSFLILLYGVLTLFFVIAFVYTWYVNIKQNKLSEKLLKSGKKLKTAKDDVKSMLDGQFHKTLLALPTLGVTVFTILPIVFMILVAFTNYDEQHRPPGKLFSWVGAENFQTLLSAPENNVSVKILNKTDTTASIELISTDGDTLNFTTLDPDAAALAQALTIQPNATLAKSKNPTEYQGDFIQEQHTFQLLATRLDPIEFTTSHILYSHEGMHMNAFIAGKLNAYFVPGEEDQPAYLTLVNENDQFVVLQIADKAYAERITNRINGKSIKLTLEDPIHANFTLADAPANVSHQLIATNAGTTRKMAATGYSASSSAVTVDSLMQQNALVTLEDGLLTIRAENGDFIALTPADAAEAQALVDLLSPAAAVTAELTEVEKLALKAQMPDEETPTLSLLTFNKHRFTLEIDGASNRVEGFELTASGQDVTVEKIAQQKDAKITVTAAEAEDGTTALTVSSDNGESVTLKTLQSEKALAIAKAYAEADALIKAIEETVVEGATDGATADAAETNTEDAVPAPVIKMTLTALSAYYNLEVFSDVGQPVTFTANDMRVAKTASFSNTFKQVLLWTLIWAFFATFLNYFLGMLVAIMINKKGIKFKKLWRTILVITIAIPQFISLLYVSKLFAADGLINGMLQSWGWIKEPLPFWTDPSWARVTIIGINIWIGIPYLMLIATGILMNIPADLYESARIDGANAFQTYRKITLPYMLFVTGPYLLTSFTGNINNFNVIYLLSQGKPTSLDLAGNAGSTDLLITWLYKMTVDNGNYKLAAVIGILVFIVCAVINLIVYNLIPSVKNEEDFQ